MKQNIEHHIEEGGEMFLQACRALDEQKLEELGDRMLELEQVSSQAAKGE